MKEKEERLTISDKRRKEIIAALVDFSEMVQGKGKHEKHTQEKIGRCTYCSCGMRAQTG